MDFAWDDATEAFREEVRRFLAEHLPPELEDELYRQGLTHDDGFARALGERNWIAADWEREGFEALGPAAMHVLEEEFAGAEAPYYAVSTSMMVARVIQAVGSDWLKAEVLPKVVAGEATIALGMSEPEAGSDVATVQTQARQVDGGWVIDGQKMFTTNAHVADYVFLLARTDPESERHHGPHHLPGAARHRGLRGAGRLHRVGRADQHHLLHRPLHRRPLAHQRGRRAAGTR